MRQNSQQKLSRIFLSKKLKTHLLTGIFIFISLHTVLAESVLWKTDATQASDVSTNQNPTSITTYNGSIYYIYINPARQMVVAKKTGNTLVKDTVFNLEMGLDEKYHICPVIGVDKKGYIHIAGDMHNDGWKYFTTNKPEDISSWTRRYDLPGVSVTYPNFFYDKNREMYICFRHRKDDGSGGNQRVGVMKYNTENSTFTMLGGISYTEKDGTTATTKTMAWGNGWGGNDCWYIKPGHRVYFDSNNRMHFICTLINICLGTLQSTDEYSPDLLKGGFESNTHILYAYSDDLGTSWHKIDGSLITSLPLTVNNSTVALDRTANHDIIGGECELGAFDTNHPIISYQLFSDKSNHSISWNGSSWVEIKLPKGRSTNIFMSRGNGYSAWYNGYYIDYSKDGINWTTQIGSPQFPKGINGVAFTGIDREYFKQTGDFRYLGTFNNATTTSIFTLNCNVGNEGNVIPTSVSLSSKSETIDITKKKQLNATISPANVSNSNLIWSSSDASVAYVDAYGLVTARKCGTATITVTTLDGNKTAGSLVTVAGGKPVAGVSLSKNELLLKEGGYSKTVKATVLPVNACNSEVLWISGNPLIATVDKNGTITPVLTGTCDIICKTADKSKTAICKVTVQKGVNLLLNPEFDNATDNWIFSKGDGGSEGEFKVVSNAGMSGKNAAEIIINDKGSRIQSLSLKQTLTLQKNKTYYISFVAKADAPRKIGVLIAKGVAPYSWYWMQNSVNLSTTATTYKYKYLSGVDDTTTSLSFLFGTDANTVYLDNVSVSIVDDINELKQ